jgi:outer membrane lipoprotein SlyB
VGRTAAGGFGSAVVGGVVGSAVAGENGTVVGAGAAVGSAAVVPRQRR